jgi:hypothetical protein
MLTKYMNVLRAGQTLSSGSHAYDFPKLIGNMKRSTSWVSGELNSVVLLNSPCKQVLLTALHEETEIDYFQENDRVTLQIIEGALQFYTVKESITLRKGQFFTLLQKGKYSLTTIEETCLLMTISKCSEKEKARRRAISVYP